MEGETSADMSVPDEPLNAAKLLPDQRLLQQLLEVIREGDDHIAFELADAIETVADGEDFVQAHIYQARAFLYARCGASAERDFWKAAALATIDTVCEKGNAIDSKWMDSLRQYVVRNVPARQPDQHGAIGTWSHTVLSLRRLKIVSQITASQNCRCKLTLAQRARPLNPTSSLRLQQAQSPRQSHRVISPAWRRASNA